MADIMGFAQMYEDIRRMNIRMIVEQILSFGLIVSSALILWKSLSVVTGAESPIVVVLSGSMEPAFFRGDLLFLYQTDAPFEVGEIVVYQLPGKEIPIVHRIHRIHEKNATTTSKTSKPKDKSSVKILTKGDNNEVHDRGLYNTGMKWLEKQHIIGRVAGNFPYVGMITIYMNEFPMLKWIIIGLMALFVLANRE